MCIFNGKKKTFRCVKWSLRIKKDVLSWQQQTPKDDSEQFVLYLGKFV